MFPTPAIRKVYEALGERDLSRQRKGHALRLASSARRTNFGDKFASETFDHRRHRTGGWLMSRLLGEDGSKNSGTRPAGVGGYYELYEYDKSGISPIDAILTAFISYLDEEKGGFRFAKPFFHKCFDGHLCILSLKRPSQGSGLGDDVRISTRNKPVRTTVVDDHVHISPNYLLLQRSVWK